MPACRARLSPAAPCIDWLALERARLGLLASVPAANRPLDPPPPLPLSLAPRMERNARNPPRRRSPSASPVRRCPAMPGQRSPGGPTRTARPPALLVPAVKPAGHRPICLPAGRTSARVSERGGCARALQGAAAPIARARTRPRIWAGAGGARRPLQRARAPALVLISARSEVQASGQTASGLIAASTAAACVSDVCVSPGLCARLDSFCVWAERAGWLARCVRGVMMVLTLLAGRMSSCTVLRAP